MTIVQRSDVAANEQAEAVETFLDFVKSNSPFYKEFWSTILSAQASGSSLEHYPLTDHAAYWQANTCLNSNVVTSEQQDGIIFKTGGNEVHHEYIAACHHTIGGISLNVETDQI